jgi:hypothetical protein
MATAQCPDGFLAECAGLAVPRNASGKGVKEHNPGFRHYDHEHLRLTTPQCTGPNGKVLRSMVSTMIPE